MGNLSTASLLQELIRIPSVSSLSNRPLIEFVQSILQSRGWHLRELPYHDSSGVEKVNLLATPPWQTANDFCVDLALVCHTDTVPYSVSWKNAVDPQVIDDAMHGCGACDVKGFLASLLCALLQTPAANFALTVALVLTAEEEIGCVGARRVLDSGLLRPRNVIVGEPTSLYPAIAGKGYGLAEIRVFGKEAHSAHPHMGASAIYRASRLIGRIEQYSLSLKDVLVSESGRIFDPPYTTFNVGVIEGGTAKNVIAAECTFLLEWRSLPGETAGKMAQTCQNLVRELQVDDPDFRYEIDILREQSGFETSAESPLLRRWVDLTGLSPIGVSFGTEAPLMAKLAQDTIVLGPGDMRTAHSPREYVPLHDLERCAGYLRELFAHPLAATQ